MDPTFELEKRRNRPVKYDRDLVGATLRAMALRVAPTKSRSYFTGRFRRFSSSKVGSTAISLPLTLRKALVQRTFRGLRFRLKFLWHFERQKWNCGGGRTRETLFLDVRECDRYVIRTRNLQDWNLTRYRCANRSD